VTADARWMIRALNQDDLPLYRPLRLEALRAHPDAFGSSLEEERDSDLSHLIGDRPNLTLGGFVDDGLVGTAGLFVSPKVKQRHKGHVFGVYVNPAWRRTGLAVALLDRLISEARANELVVLTLSVTIGNEAARRLYLRAGFFSYGTEPAGRMIGSELLDEELMALRLDRH
jgi:ribosomal protein S18 acetylase RimI-like enzyme